MNQTSPEGSTSTSTKTPPADVVRAEASKVEIKAGGSAEAFVKLTIANGYHINANPPSFPYLIPTALQLQPSYDLTAETPIYPPSISKKFKFAEQPIAVYESEVTISVMLRAESKAPKGDHALGARVRVQPCDEESCYPPRNIETSIPVTIK
jgi:thiol:disulfide interchange protein DsbD